MAHDLDKEYAVKVIVNRLESPHRYKHLTNTKEPQSST
jgi:hypothetical protein